MAKSRTGYNKTVLDNGVRVITERMENIRSLALGFWFDTGSRDEPDELSGISHFLEHMNFKGTPTRSAAAIARQIEGRGGHLNAFTSREITCFHARVIDQQLSKAVDVLSDITQHSTFDSKEINRERNVILEELKSVEDTPDELVFEYFLQQLFRGHSMGRSVLGNRESLAYINSARMRKFRKEYFSGSRVVISAAGNLDHNRLVKMIDRRFNDGKAPNGKRKHPKNPSKSHFRENKYTNTQQAHICIGCRGLKYVDNEKYVFLVMNTILGGGMSSRLFQRVREKHGLAYSVFSFLETYQDTGIFGVYAGTDPDKAEKAINLINRETRDLTRKKVSSRELQRTKDQLKGNLLLGLEAPGSIMHRLAKMEIYAGGWTPIDDVVDKIDAVTPDDILALSQELFKNRTQFTTVLLPN